MSIKTRHAALLDEVRTRGSVSVEALAEQFGVTLQTVRRDVQQLADAGLLTRFHGGVRLPSSTTENIGYRQRQALQADEKARIARAVAERVPNNCSLILNIGTTTEAVARELMHHRGLRVITNNLNVAALLCGNAEFEVIVAGGVVRGDRGVIGESTIDFVRQFKVDYGVIGISGIDEDGTLLDFDYREVRVAQAIIENARHVLLVADHTKFGCNPMVRLGHLSEIDALFTDRQPPESIVEVLDKASVTLHVSGAEAGDE